MKANDKISGKDLPTRPSDEAIIRSLTSLSRGTQVRIIKRMMHSLPTVIKIKLLREFTAVAQEVASKTGVS